MCVDEAYFLVPQEAKTAGFCPGYDVDALLKDAAIGRLQLIQASFGFPLTDSSNIRMNPEIRTPSALARRSRRISAFGLRPAFGPGPSAFGLFNPTLQSS